MNILKVSKQNIDAVMGYTESIEEKSLGLDASFIYQTSRATLAQLKSRVAIEPNLAKQLKKTVYGANILHFALLNPNIEVFKYVLELFEQQKIKVEKHSTVKIFRKIVVKDKYVYLMPGTTLMNVALSIANVEKMQLLESLGLSEIALPKIDNTNQYIHQNTLNEQSTLLTYCNFLAAQPQELAGYEKAAFYFNFATSFKNFPELLEDLGPKYLNDSNRLGMTAMQFGTLLHLENAFKSEKFRTDYYPIILQAVSNLYFYRYGIIKDVEQVVSKSIEYFSHYAKPSEYAAIQTVFKPMKNKPYLTQLEICKDRAILMSTLDKSNDRKNVTKL